MFDSYPRLVLRERKVVFSKHELIDIIKRAAKARKQCEISLYSFKELKDNKPIIESTVIDCILWEGTLEFCKTKMKEMSKYKSIILSDEEKAKIIVFKNSSLEELQELRANTNLQKMIVIPGYVDLRTGRKWRIVERNVPNK